MLGRCRRRGRRFGKPRNHSARHGAATKLGNFGPRPDELFRRRPYDLLSAEAFFSLDDPLPLESDFAFLSPLPFFSAAAAFLYDSLR